jgi:prevent-host-death family protein
MTAIVNVHEAKTHFSKLLERAHAGEEVIIAKAGKPYARLVKLEEAAALPFQREPGGWPELALIPDGVWLEPTSDDELDAWEGKYSNIV